MRIFTLLIVSASLFRCGSEDVKESDFYLTATRRFGDEVNIQLSIDDFPSKFQSGRAYSIPITSDTFYESFVFEFTLNREKNNYEYFKIEFRFRFPAHLYDTLTKTSINSDDELESLLRVGNWSLNSELNEFARVSYQKNETLYYEPWYDQFALTKNLLTVTSVEQHSDNILGEGFIVKGEFEVDILSVRGEKNSITLQDGLFKIFIRRR